MNGEKQVIVGNGMSDIFSVEFGVHANTVGAIAVFVRLVVLLARGLCRPVLFKGLFY